jgi:aminoglycoside phosphotransferase (APT) family kinase protein
MIDQPAQTRTGEELNKEALSLYLRNQLAIAGEISIQQFPSGYSNLTYLIQSNHNEFVLRRPPIGANVKSAHDMAREFNVLACLRKAGYQKSPEPVLLCEDESIIGSKFYLMKRVKGVILRNRVPKDLSIQPATFHALSKSAIDQMVHLHQLDLHSSGLGQLGKPDGYVQRQVEGWTKRYENSQTDEIDSLNETSEWMKKNLPDSSSVAFVHNDFKYDNLVLDPGVLTQVLAVLDWEMATVGDPVMDLGTTLAYWAEATDSDALKPFNLTWMPGNLTRQEVLNYYQEKSGKSIDSITFYYAFGSFKVAVICQQIYFRYKKGVTQDPRFASLIHVIKACGENARRAITNLKI